MEHYPFEAWIDYVRGCGSGEARERMSRHAGTCERCRRLETAVQALRETLIADRDYAVPDDVVEAAVRLFNPPAATRRRPRRRRNGPVE